MRTTFIASLGLALALAFIASRSTAAELSTEQLARIAQNPLANVISVPFQYNANFDVGPLKRRQDILNIQADRKSKQRSRTTLDPSAPACHTRAPSSTRSRPVAKCPGDFRHSGPLSRIVTRRSHHAARFVQRRDDVGIEGEKTACRPDRSAPSGEMRGLKFEAIRHHPPGIICSASTSFARQRAVRPPEVAASKLVVYRAKEFPEYHRWVSKVLGVSKTRLVISEECSDVMSLVAAVQAGRGVAVVGDFITALAGDRVRFVPFISGAHFLEVGLLYRKSGLGENIGTFIAASMAGRQLK